MRVRSLKTDVVGLCCHSYERIAARRCNYSRLHKKSVAAVFRSNDRVHIWDTMTMLLQGSTAIKLLLVMIVY